MNPEDVTTITPNHVEHPDDQARNLRCLAECFEAAQVYLLRVAEARPSGETTDLELAQDQLLDLLRGVGRAAERRERDLGTLLRNRRIKAVG
jgi:hypothetical protein